MIASSIEVKTSRLFELPRVLVRFDHVSSSIDGATLSLLVVACSARGAIACGGFGFARNTAATFDVFFWLQVTNFQVTNFGLLKSAPNRADYNDIRRSVLHNQLLVGTFALGCSTDTLLASVLIVHHALKSPA